mmetsp:Transcript_60801/g.175931  ORF Transcript_60801/g.175931 Transcript_60801/m.175931 type:complete len:221 (+) Transcript_60801:1-663(+)
MGPRRSMSWSSRTPCAVWGTPRITTTCGCSSIALTSPTAGSWSSRSSCESWACTGRRRSSASVRPSRRCRSATAPVSPCPRSASSRPSRRCSSSCRTPSSAPWTPWAPGASTLMASWISPTGAGSSAWRSCVATPASRNRKSSGFGACSTSVTGRASGRSMPPTSSGSSSPWVFLCGPGTSRGPSWTGWTTRGVPPGLLAPSRSPRKAARSCASGISCSS